MKNKSTRSFLRLHGLLGRLPMVSSLHRFVTDRHSSVIPDRELFGLVFKTPVGLGADIDRNGEFIDVLADFGFGHICIGPLTSEAQEDDAEIPNKGIRYAIRRVASLPFSGILAIDLCCNRGSNTESLIVKDFNTAFSLSYDFADFFILDFRPSWIRSKTDPTLIANIFDTILETRLSYDSYKPVLLRLPPALPYQILDEIVSYLRLNGVDGLVLSDRDAISHVRAITQGDFPTIAADLLNDSSEATKLISDGADLIEISSAFVNSGGGFLNSIYRNLEQKAQDNNLNQ